MMNMTVFWVSAVALVVTIPIDLGGIALMTAEMRTKFVVPRSISTPLAFVLVLSVMLTVIALAFLLFSHFVVDGKVIMVGEIASMILATLVLILSLRY